mgnify:FL=1
MDKRVAETLQFQLENADIIAAQNNSLGVYPVVINAEQDAKGIVIKYFPTFDDSDIERLQKSAIMKYLRKQEPYKEAVEKECRRQWLKQSIDIFQMLIESHRLESELRSGLKFDPVEDKAHSEFYLSYITMPTNTFEKIKWDIVDKYQDQVEL